MKQRCAEPFPIVCVKKENKTCLAVMVEGQFVCIVLLGMVNGIVSLLVVWEVFPVSIPNQSFQKRVAIHQQSLGLSLSLNHSVTRE